MEVYDEIPTIWKHHGTACVSLNVKRIWPQGQEYRKYTVHPARVNRPGRTDVCVTQYRWELLSTYPYTNDAEYMVSCSGTPTSKQTGVSFG
jgi:hypothetical protein